ncbi:MAG: hypothetical protein R3Y55_03715 [Rikenellaceae bacterium]
MLKEDVTFGFKHKNGHMKIYVGNFMEGQGLRKIYSFLKLADAHATKGDKKRLYEVLTKELEYQKEGLVKSRVLEYQEKLKDPALKKQPDEVYRLKVNIRQYRHWILDSARYEKVIKRIEEMGWAK